MEISFGAQAPKLLSLETLPQELQSAKWWLISIPGDKDIIWDIALAYLITSTSSGFSEQRSIRRLLNKKTVSKAAGRCVQEYNPFVSSRRSICNERMEEIVDEFGIRINECGKTLPTMEDNHKKMFVASLLLSCNILFHCKRKSPGNTTEYSSQWFPRKNPLKAFETTLILLNGFRETEDDVLCKSYSFLLPETNGKIKQKLALGEILKKTKVESHILSCICELENIGEDFICRLLESDFADNIPLIYKSPYILSKLKDAQLMIDPRQISDLTGESALYHASQLQRTDLLYFLYNQAVCDCYSAQGSVRSPNSIILNNLECVKNELTNMKDKTVIEKEKYLKKLDELSRFNEFQTEVCKKMFSILQPNGNYHESGTDKQEAEKAKDVILSVTKTYMKYFNWSDVEDAIRIPKLELFKIFCKHKDYFDSVDFCAAVMFFDNIYLLKERLCLPNKYCSKIESEFFTFVYCRKYFDVDESKAKTNSVILSKVIMFHERQVLQRNLTEFQDILSREIVSEKNIRKRVPDEEILELTDQEHIYGRILLFRLKHYLDAAVSVSLKNPTAMYVTLRAVQVLGECVKDNDFKSIQTVLTMSMPARLVSELKQIRNNLSHLNSSEYVYRERIEKDAMLLKKIQIELKNLKNLLSPIFSSQRLSMEYFDLKCSLKAVNRLMKGKIPKEQWNSLKEILPNLKAGENIKESKKKIGFRVFSQIRNSLVYKLKKCWNCTTINKNSRCFKFLIDNLISNTKLKLSSFEKLKKAEATLFKESIEAIQNLFWSTEFLLEYLVRDSSLKKHRRKVLKVIKLRLLHFERTNLNYEQMTIEAFFKLIKEAENLIEDYTIVKNQILECLSVSDDKEENFAGIEKLCLMLKGKIFLNREEKFKVRNSVDRNLRIIHLAKNVVIKTLKNDFTKPMENLSVWIDCLGLSSSKKQDVLQSLNIGDLANALDVVIDIKDIYGELEEVLNNNTIKKKKFDDLTKKIDFNESSKAIIENLIEGQKVKVKGNDIHFIIDRIKNLEECLLHSNKEIETIWNCAKSERKKNYLREKIVELYMNEPTIQAAIEMLLFDCVMILKSEKLENLLKKSERLFKGMYLRNLLAHGKPILEMIGKFLDPEDLPLEIVSKVLQLISDKMALKCILELYNNCNQDYKEMSRILLDDEDFKFAKLREEIQKCERWKAYIELLP